MKKEETHNQSLNVSEDAGWSRCPICNEIWRIWYFRYPFYAIWEHYNLPSANIHEQLCPVHAEVIVIDGRAKGKRTILNQDELKEISETGLHCPVCKNKKLKLADHVRETYSYSWTCKGCKASIITEQSPTIDGNMEIKYCSVREDLGKRSTKKSSKQKLGILENDTYSLRKM